MSVTVEFNQVGVMGIEIAHHQEIWQMDKTSVPCPSGLRCRPKYYNPDLRETYIQRIGMLSRLTASSASTDKTA